jgi:hypothetical protein
MLEPDGPDHRWENDRWWRVVSTSGTKLWCETSDEKEARAAMDECPYPARLDRHQVCTAQRWEEEQT